MKKISIIISLDQTLKDLELTLKNLNNGNFAKWNLTPILPVPKNENETYQDAAKRFWQDSGWIEGVQVVIPKIEKWWSEIGGMFASSLAIDLGVIEPEKYNIILIPFGPGGSYNNFISGVYVRITDFEKDSWWQHVIVHEITHLLSFSLENPNHQKNENRVNELMKKKLIEFGLGNLT